MARNAHQGSAAAANQHQGNGSNKNMYTQNQNQLQDPSQKPYFLHPNESPNQVLVSPTFTVSSYHT